jgi:hypothetical protein
MAVALKLASGDARTRVGRWNAPSTPHTLMASDVMIKAM